MTRTPSESSQAAPTWRSPKGSSPALSRFDVITILVIVLLAVLAAFIVLLNGRPHVKVVEQYPAPESPNVSILSTISVTFDQPIEGFASAPIRLEPMVGATVNLEENRLTFDPDGPLAPGRRYRVIVDGVRGRFDSVLERPSIWEFETRWPRLLYKQRDANGNFQLFSVDPRGGQPVPLTAEAADVGSYDVYPDGSRIAYSLDGGTNSSIWQINADGTERQLLLDCGRDALCNGAVWAPAGDRLIYERKTLRFAGAPPGPARLYWLDARSGETVPVFADSQWFGYGPRLSADGEWLSYIATLTGEVHLFHLESGRNVVSPSMSGEPGAWSPARPALVTNRVTTVNGRGATHLLLVEAEEGSTINLSGDDFPGNDRLPAWSPAGDWVAFSRQRLDLNLTSQIWTIRADGRNAVQLTDEAGVYYGQPFWSPDGRYLAYRRTRSDDPSGGGSIWLLDVAARDTRELVPGGFRPRWLP